MKNTLVIYNSKYGTTKKYAQWLAEELDADIRERSKAGIKDLLVYQNIVYGGSLHAVGIRGLKLITNNLDRLAGKKIAVFSVGCSSIREQTVQAVVKHNFPGGLPDQIKLFCLRGGFDYGKLGFVDKILMGLMKKKLDGIKPENRDEDTRGLLEAYDHPVDFTDRQAIQPIAAYIKEG
jgi:menaquinone-dependent protoporphyrinogen IX oxidase